MEPEFRGKFEISRHEEEVIWRSGDVEVVWRPAKLCDVSECPSDEDEAVREDIQMSLKQMEGGLEALHSSPPQRMMKDDQRCLFEPMRA